MTAIWGHIRAVSSTERMQAPLMKKARRNNIDTDNNDETDMTTPRGQHGEDAEKVFWQNNFDTRMNALGIRNQPKKYEIQRGKTVRQWGRESRAPQLERSPPLRSIEDDVNSIFATPPPRNPLRQRKNIEQQQPPRPTSSVYGEAPSAVPSPLHVTSPTMDPRAAALQISPPSSPDLSPARRPSPDDVSPIDEDFDMTQQYTLRGPRSPPRKQTTAAQNGHHQSPKSGIPAMRRDRRKLQDAAATSRRDPRPKGTPMHVGYPSQAALPFEVEQSASNPAELPMGCTTTISGPSRPQRNQPSPSFGERVRQFGIGRAKPEPLDSRPAWNGASGRAPLIQPVRDTPNAAPLRNQPPPHAKRAGRGRGALPSTGPTHPGPSETPAKPAVAAPRTTSAQTARQQQEAMQRMQISPRDRHVGASSPQDASLDSDNNGARSYPSPPYSGSPMRMSPETTLPASNPATLPSPKDASVLPIAPIVIPNTEKAIKRKPPPSQATPVQAVRASYSSSVHTSATADRTSAIVAPEEDSWVQPPSRFSISTHATTTVDTPRASVDQERPPLPTASAEIPSVMDRSRPRRLDDGIEDQPSGEPIVISMKPFDRAAREAAGIHAVPRRKQGSIDIPKQRPLSVMSTDKALPLAPPELSSAHDRVGNLNARLGNLAHRRVNINKSIKQMTELMPSDNLMASKEVLRKRESERIKVEGLKAELANVQQEEYELGLKLHRAYKRLDREAEFEPTGLWVRRVTG